MSALILHDVMKSLRQQLPSMNALFAFEAAGRLGNFTRAAQELNVTPAAVSRMMQRLEEHLGTALFLRGQTVLRLSDNGRILHDATSRAMALIGTGLSDIEDNGRNDNTVTLSVSTAFTTHWLMPRMHRFKAAFPTLDLRFQLVMGALTGPVNDVDLGMRFVNPGEVDTRHRIFQIMPEVLIPLCSPGYFERSKQAQTAIILSGGQPLPRDHLQLSGRSLSFDDYAIVVQAALLGQGICWGWLNVVGHWMRERQLVPARAQVHVTERVCCMLQLDRQRRPIVEQVRDWIVDELQSDYVALQNLYPDLGIP